MVASQFRTSSVAKVVHNRYVTIVYSPCCDVRDPKDITTEEYQLFYQNTFKDFELPLAWHHFSGDDGDGVSFKAIVYIPGKLSVTITFLGICILNNIADRDQSYWNNPLMSESKDIRLMVKRTFITSDLGENGMPKWASWVKVVADGQLPLVACSAIYSHIQF